MIWLLDTNTIIYAEYHGKRGAPALHQFVTETQVHRLSAADIRIGGQRAPGLARAQVVVGAVHSVEAKPDEPAVGDAEADAKRVPKPKIRLSIVVRPDGRSVRSISGRTAVTRGRPVTKVATASAGWRADL